MVNKVILVGNLGRDPEVRALPGGQQVANFSLATSRAATRTGTATARRRPSGTTSSVYGKQAEIAGQYLTKGKMIFVEGRIQTRSWDDKEDRQEAATDRDHLRQLPDARLQGRRRRQWRRWRQGRRLRARPRAAAMTGGAGDFQDDDIPF